MDLTAVTERLDTELRTSDYADLDVSAKGLQVGDTGTVEHAAFAVDAALETIERAGKADADVLVTHHGLIWDGLERVTGIEHQRLGALYEYDLALYVSHLPLDGHPELGNAAGLALELGLETREPFGTLGPVYIGQRGRMPYPISPDAFRDRVAAVTDPTHEVRLFDFGPSQIETVGVITGSGVDWIEEAADSDLDALVTGEGKQQLYHEAKELGISVVLAGHYATETFGVRALAGLAEDWGLETTVLDCPTRL